MIPVAKFPGWGVREVDKIYTTVLRTPAVLNLFITLTQQHRCAVSINIGCSPVVVFELIKLFMSPIPTLSLKKWLIDYIYFHCQSQIELQIFEDSLVGWLELDIPYLDD